MHSPTKCAETFCPLLEERPPPLPSLCDAYIATCDRVRVTPSGAALCSLTADCESITLDVRDLRELWALVETLKHHHASLHQQKQPLSGKGLKTEAEAAAAVTLQRAGCHDPHERAHLVLGSRSWP